MWVWWIGITGEKKPPPERAANETAADDRYRAVADTVMRDAIKSCCSSKWHGINDSNNQAYACKAERDSRELDMWGGAGSYLQHQGDIRVVHPSSRHIRGEEDARGGCPELLGRLLAGRLQAGADAGMVTGQWLMLQGDSLLVCVYSPCVREETCDTDYSKTRSAKGVAGQQHGVQPGSSGPDGQVAQISHQTHCRPTHLAFA